MFGNIRSNRHTMTVKLSSSKTQKQRSRLELGFFLASDRALPVCVVSITNSYACHCILQAKGMSLQRYVAAVPALGDALIPLSSSSCAKELSVIMEMSDILSHMIRILEI